MLPTAQRHRLMVVQTPCDLSIPFQHQLATGNTVELPRYGKKGLAHHMRSYVTIEHKQSSTLAAPLHIYLKAKEAWQQQ